MEDNVYKIKMEDLRLEENIVGPVLYGSGSKNGYRLYRQRYHVTVVHNDQTHIPGYTLEVGPNFECHLVHGDTRHELDEAYLSENRFVFVDLEEQQG